MCDVQKQYQCHNEIHDRFYLIVVIAGDPDQKQTKLDILSFDKSKTFQADYRAGCCIIKVLHEATQQPLILLTGDLTQNKVVITFKQLKSDKAVCRFCERKLTDKTSAVFDKNAEMKESEALQNVCNYGSNRNGLS